MKAVDIIDLVAFALDHYAHFQAWPVEFEIADGKVYSQEEYWPVMVAIDNLQEREENAQ